MDRHEQKNNTALSPFSFKKWVKSNLMLFFFLAFLVVIAYANALNNSFVSDDRGLIINVPFYTLESLISKPFSFIRDFDYFLIYKIFGFNPFIFRFPNIIFHIGSVWLIFILVNLFKNRTVGMLSAALFAIHPILVESVTWISGGIYTQYSFFFILSFLTYAISSSNKKFYVISLICFMLSLLSSEKVVVLCLIPLFYEICFGNLKKNWKRVCVYFALSFVYLFISFGLLGRLGTRISGLQADQSFSQTFYNPLIQIPVAITSYLQLIFWPDNLTLYHSEMVFSQLEYIIRVCFFLGFSGFGIYCFKRNRFIFFWLSFFIITLLPTFTPFGIAWVVAERYVYLGSLGIFVLIALVFYTFLLKFKKLKMHIYVVFTILVIGFTTRTIVRNIDWQNEDNLWLATAKTSPSSSQNHNNLGDYYGRHGDLENSVREYKRAIELKPNYAAAYHNLGNAYRDMGEPTEALKSYQKALSINSNLWQSYQNMAMIYYQQEKFDLAMKFVQKAMSIETNNTQLMAFMGLIYLKTNDISKAKEIFLNVLKIDPQNQLAKEGLSQISP